MVAGDAFSKRLDSLKPPGQTAYNHDQGRLALVSNTVNACHACRTLLRPNYYFAVRKKPTGLFLYGTAFLSTRQAWGRTDFFSRGHDGVVAAATDQGLGEHVGLGEPPCPNESIVST